MARFCRIFPEFVLLPGRVIHVFVEKITLPLTMRGVNSSRTVLAAL